MKKLCAALAAGCVCCVAVHVNAQTATAVDHSPKAAITFDTGESLDTPSIEGLFQRVAAKTNQAIKVQLKYPTDLAGQPILVQSMDGAQIIGNTVAQTVAEDGTATMVVRLGSSEGIYRFVLRCSDSTAALRFYAVRPGSRSPDPTLLQPAFGR